MIRSQSSSDRALRDMGSDLPPSVYARRSFGLRSSSQPRNGTTSRPSGPPPPARALSPSTFRSPSPDPYESLAALAGTRYDKVIKLATKPKHAPPKAKYIDPIIASTFSQDGSLQDICKALGPRLREPNSTVVFKALIVLHTMIRNGSVDNVLNHLASDSNNLRLKSVSSGNWQGYDAPKTISVYAHYLDERIRAYREIKRDVIRSSDSARARHNGADGSNRLRRLTVEKGLLREVAATQKVCAALLECSFFWDDMEDEVTLTAFRMTIKDLLALYTAINEGVINILEHYFEMSHTDAGRALELYKRFCRQTEKVVAYLSSARKVSHTINVPIPNLKHAPVSLAGALEEYLKDPNFEQNRIEYRENKKVADRGGSSQPVPVTDAKKEPCGVTAAKEPAKDAKASTSTTPAKSTASTKPASNNQALVDFFASIENEQTDMFNPSTAPPPSFLSGNAFAGQQPAMNGGMGMGMGMGMGGQMGGGGVQPQMTGYNPFMAGLGGGMNAQMTGMPGAGAGMMQPQATGFSQQQQQQQPFMQEQPFMQAQPTGFLQPQATGFNPFRQSMLMPQGTGMGAFGGGGMQQPQQTGLSPFGSMMPAGVGPDPNSNPQNGQQQQQQQNQTSLNAAFGSQPPNTSSVPTPTTSTAPTPSALKPQKTGSRNPFAPPPGETPPPTPPPPTNAPSLSQLAAGAFTGGGRYGLGANAWDGSNPATQTQQQPVQNHQEQQKPLGPQPTGIIGSVASEFAFGRNNAASPAPAPALSPSATGMPGSSGNANANGLGSSFGMLSISGASSPGIQSASSAPQAQLQPQPTGFGGSAIKPFKPESAFGAELAASRTFSPPPTNAFSPGPSENAGRGMSSAASSSALSAQPTSGANPFARFSVSPAPGASGAGSSLAPSATGAQGWTSFGGAGNGIGAPSNFLTSSSNGSNGLNSSTSAPSLAPQPTGFGGSTIKPFQPTSAFGTSVLGAGAGAQGQAGQNGLNGQQNPNTGANSGTTFGTLF